MGKFIKAAGVIDSYTGLNGVPDGNGKNRSTQNPGKGFFKNQFQFPAGNAGDVEQSPSSRRGIGNIVYKGGATKNRSRGTDYGPINFNDGKISNVEVFKDQ